LDAQGRDRDLTGVRSAVKLRLISTRKNSMPHEMLTTLAQKVASENAALVVVDVQNDFVATGGFFESIGGDVGLLQRTTIPSLLRLIDKAREVGVLVVFVTAIYDKQYRSAPMEERKLRMTNDRWPCISGTWGADFYAVKPLPGEPIVIKHRYSGMIGTELASVLKKHGVSSLLMTGVATDTCVESTARDAYFMDYYVSLVSDCCGALSEADHLSALPRFARDYGLVVTSHEVLSVWQGMNKKKQSEANNIA
jgi:ureidoacrylate peracid hydrolase